MLTCAGDSEPVAAEAVQVPTAVHADLQAVMDGQVGLDPEKRLNRALTAP